MTKKIFNQSVQQSWKDYKEGFNRLKPIDHAIAKRVGHFWAILGAGTASVSLLTQGISKLFYAIINNNVESSIFSTLGFGLLVGAISYLQFIEWRKENQKVSGLEKMEESMKEQTTLEQTEAV